MQQLVSTVSPLQGNNERCIDGAKAEANRELIKRDGKQDKEVAAIATLREKVGNPLFERLAPLRR